MALSAKLTMRQGQTMVLTPQLLQAIKLLQMPNVELSAFIENELTSNPLFERAEDHEGREAERLEGPPETPAAEALAEPGDWASDALETNCAALEANLGTEIENAFEPDRTAPAADSRVGEGLPTGSWAGTEEAGRRRAQRRTSRPMCRRPSRCTTTSSARLESSCSIRRSG